MMITNRTAAVIGAMVLLVLLSCLQASAENTTGEEHPAESTVSEVDSSSITASLITVGPGDELYSWWGHSAIVIEEHDTDTRILYDYGQFSFDADNFIRNFIFGRLWFSVGRARARYALDFWKSQDRYIGIQILNLSPEKEKELKGVVEHDWLPENRVYLYDHYYDNCATRERDILNRIVEGQLKEAYNEPSPYTLRDLTRQYTYHHPFGQFFLMLIQGRTIDTPITLYDEMFLPHKIEKYIASFAYRNEKGEEVPLVESSFLYSEAPHRKKVLQDPPRPTLYMCTLGISLAAIAALLRVRSRKGFGMFTSIYSFLFGLIGSIMFFMSFFTNHTVMHANENLLFINPLLLIAAPFFIGIAGGQKRSLLVNGFIYSFLVVMVLILIVLKLTGYFFQDNVEFILFFLPVYAVFGPVNLYYSFGGRT